MWWNRRTPVVLSSGWLALLCGVAFFRNLGILGLVDKTEALQVEVTRRMAASGDWITPFWNGAPYFDKPVWPYWMGGLSFRFFGVSPLAARLPSALAASAVVLAVFALLWLLAEPAERPRSRWGRAALGAGMMALSPGWIAWGVTGVHDVHLVAGISFALFGYVACLSSRLPRRGRWVAAVLMPLGMALGVLAKGPLGCLLPLVVILLDLLRRRRLDLLRSHPRRIIALAALFLALAAPWYVLILQARGDAFLHHFFGFSNLQRLTSVVNRHDGPWWFYLPVVVLLLFPWSLYLPAAALRLWRDPAFRPRPGAEPRGDLAELACFTALWFGFVLVLFSAITTKLSGYVLPLLPAAVLLVAITAVPPDGSRRGDRAFDRTALLNLALLPLIALAAALAPRWLATDSVYPGFREALLPLVRGLALPLLLAALAVAVGLPLLERRGRRPRPVFALLALDLALLLAFLAFGVPVFAAAFRDHCQRPVQEIARRATRELAPAETTHVVGTPYYSVVFYGGRPVRFGSPLDDLEEGRLSSTLAIGSPRSLQRIRKAGMPIEVLAREARVELVRVRARPGSGVPGA